MKITDLKISCIILFLTKWVISIKLKKNINKLRGLEILIVDGGCVDWTYEALKKEKDIILIISLNIKKELTIF